MRFDGRESSEFRNISITTGVNPYAEGSVEVCFGHTKVLVTASLETDLPPWMKDQPRGWITAEYGMLPRSTHTRNKREAAQGKQGGRTLEIQRLIGRALRAAVALEDIKGLTIRLDCDVLCADGGTRTASICGASVALCQAIEVAKKKGLVSESATVKNVAAVSVGKLNEQLLLDLAYEEDSKADFDLNLVFNNSLGLIEVQGTAEASPISKDELLSLLALGEEGARKVIEIQNDAISRMKV